MARGCEKPYKKDEDVAHDAPALLPGQRLCNVVSSLPKPVSIGVEARFSSFPKAAQGSYLILCFLCLSLIVSKLLACHC